jgi:hypothetical protein
MKKNGRPFGSFKKSPVRAPKLTERQQKMKEKLEGAVEEGELRFEKLRNIYTP